MIVTLLDLLFEVILLSHATHMTYSFATWTTETIIRLDGVLCLMFFTEKTWSESHNSFPFLTCMYMEKIFIERKIKELLNISSFKHNLYWNREERKNEQVQNNS